MQLTDGTRIFDSEVIDEAAKKLQRDEQEREMLNAFARYAYLRYKQIRNCVNPRKCKYMRVDQVLEQLKSPGKLQKVSNLFNITEEEVHYIVDFVKKYLKYIK
ncbi:hypothetical protein FJQ98_11875 [Lysinibacillus agricola]|uniref:Uncharacterized protein n=1 Tax=Lysinibacillus agricola TaxID=2590012 RepID=A0ABX7AXE9_9BACI|nr:MULTISPECIES: hypothetical protein [Lysinibacillus]KOS60334.1 hypothetical protein AN161_24980 [Lysinibacillus sp. FJAT-14222]QQP14633.1 hypothetical protein FJQ98_11875 [Lysinibacillus agricola]